MSRRVGTSKTRTLEAFADSMSTEVMDLRAKVEKLTAENDVLRKHAIEKQDQTEAMIDRWHAERDELRATSESWRLAHERWQTWGARMREAVGGTLNGDSPTRDAIAAELEQVKRERDEAQAALAVARTEGDEAISERNLHVDAFKAQKRERDSAIARANLEAAHHAHLRTERDAARARLAELGRVEDERDIAIRQRDLWQADAERFAANSDHWRGKFEEALALLAAARSERDAWRKRAEQHGCDIEKGDPDCG